MGVEHFSQNDTKALEAMEAGTFEVPTSAEEQVTALKLTAEGEHTQVALLLLDSLKDRIIDAIAKGTQDITQLSAEEQGMLQTVDDLGGVTIFFEDLAERGIDEESLVEIISRLNRASLEEGEVFDFAGDTKKAVEEVIG